MLLFPLYFCSDEFHTSARLIDECIRAQRSRARKLQLIIHANSPTHTEVLLEESTEYKHIQDGEETFFVHSKANKKTGHCLRGNDTNVQAKTSVVFKDSGSSLSQRVVRTTESPLLPILSVQEQDDYSEHYGAVNTH